MTDRERCLEIYHEAFGIAEEFDKLFFDYYFDNTETLCVDGEIVSMLFKIPCTVKLGDCEQKAYYIYAVATDKRYRGKGLMSQLINKCCNEEDALYFLKPVKESLIAFYENVGFYCVDAIRQGSADAVVVTHKNHQRLSAMCDHPADNYTLMMRGTPKREIKKICFKDTLE